MNDPRWQIAVRNGGDLTGATVLVTLDLEQGTVEREFEILDCISDDGVVRIYAANEI